MKHKNLIELFLEHTYTKPDKTALVFDIETKPKAFSYREISEHMSFYTEELKRLKIQKGDRVLILSRKEPRLYFFILALVACGACPVFVDAEKKKIWSHIKAIDFEAVLLDKKLTFLRFVSKKIFQKKTLSFSKSWTGIKRIKSFKKNKKSSNNITVTPLKKKDPVLITFTTGSTGEPKAADRSFEVLMNQHFVSMKHWTHKDTDVDLTFFSNILFQNLLSGVTTLVPNTDCKTLDEIDFSIYAPLIEKYRVTRLSSPPGYLNRLCKEKITYPSIKKVITGGAPVDRILAADVLKAFPEADSNIVYGSTEAEPISFLNMKDYIHSGDTHFNVGEAIDDIQVKVVDENSKEVSKYQTGEILITGPHVIKRYLNQAEDNKRFKVSDSQGTIWHRTGDMGYFNEKNQICIVGRKKHFTKTKDKKIRYSLEIENSFNTRLEGLRRCAFVEKKGQPHLYIEGEDSAQIRKKAETFLEESFLLSKLEFIDNLPVDSRHHWKIQYEKL